MVSRRPQRLYREVERGGGHVNKDMQQFLEWDNKVCRFFAVQDDMTLPTFERRPFIILYFLADDTVEVREQYPLNCGRDPYPIFFRRGKVPRGKLEVKGPLDRVNLKDDYVQVTDFTVGALHELLGNRYFIYDADPFTRNYFAKELGQELPERVDVRIPDRTVPRPATPPYNGFGSWDDSMASVLNLVPKAPKKDFEKLFNEDGKVLRFTARFASANPEDAERLFVVNYHLFDDTVMIHEPPQRNLGIVTGKYLEKGVHLNQMTGKLFQPSDLFPGAIIQVYNRKFEILDMDEYSRKYIKDGSVSRQYDTAAVMEKLREGMRQQFPLVRDIFRKFDQDHDGVITVGEFKDALRKYNFQVSDDEVTVLMKHFDTRMDGQISYNEFCDALLDEDYTKHMMQTKRPINQKYDARYAERAQAKAVERGETEKVRTAVRDIGHVIYAHAQTFQKLFKEFAHITHERTVSCRQIVEALASIGQTFTLEDVQRTVLFLMPDADLEKVNYIDFLQSMVTSYHDVAHNR